MPATKEMKPTYKIFVLDDDEYLGLHKYVPQVSEKDLKDSLGFAHPQTKEAYVRRTQCKEMDDETIMHEAMELISKHSSHEDENNIRWKKGKDVFAQIIPLAVGGIITALTGGGAAPLVGPTMASILGGAASAGTSAVTQKNMSSSGQISPLNTVLSGIGGGLLGSGMMPGITASSEVGGGLLGQVGSGLQSAVGMQSGAQKTLSQLSQPMTSGMTANELGYINTAKGTSPYGAFGNPSANVATYGAQVVPPAVNNVLGSALGANINSATQGMEKATERTLLDKVAGGGGKIDLGSLANTQNILGGAAVLGSMAPKTPQFQMPSIVSDLQGKLLQGQALSPLGQQAQMELGNILKASPTELYPTANDEYYNAALRRTRESYAEAGKQLDAAYNVAGVYGSGEHLQAKADLQEELARTESAMAAEIEQRRFEMGVNAKYQAVQQALGVDQNIMNDLLGLTGLSVQTAASMYNANVQDVEEIRKALGTLGSELIIRGTTGQGMQKGGVNINLGK